MARLLMFREDEPSAEHEISVPNESPATAIELTIARYFVVPTGNGILSHDAPLWP
ncbi:MAG TPA: hypothetical protein VF123_03240 [Candidatus Sulfotelmatobacter sp.]